MGRTIGIIIVACMCISMMIGCGKKNEEPEIKYADESFQEDLVKSLESRWRLDDDVSSNNYIEGSEEHKNALEKRVNAELEILQKYEDEKFKDSKLKELCIQYINILKDQEETLKYLTVDYNKYSEEWNAVFNERTKVLAQLKTDYDFKVSEKYQSILDDLLTNAQLVTEGENTKVKVEEFAKSIPFALEKDESGFKTYSAVVENTTGLGFKTLPLSINLLDAEGVIIETTYAQVENFGVGAKARFEFMTDKEFSAMDIITEYYQLSE